MASMADFGPEHAYTFRRHFHPDLRAEYVLANPPFNDSDGFRKDDDVCWQFGVPPKGSSLDRVKKICIPGKRIQNRIVRWMNLQAPRSSRDLSLQCNPVWHRGVPNHRVDSLTPEMMISICHSMGGSLLYGERLGKVVVRTGKGGGWMQEEERLCC